MLPSDWFRTPEYAECARRLLYNDFPKHYKATIKQVLLETNNSYSLAYKQLQEIPPPRVWSLLPSFINTERPRKPVTSIPEEIRNELEEMHRAEFEEQHCVKDAEIATELNRKQYTELFECPVCVDDVTWDECVSCFDGCVVCRACLGRVISVGVYETGDLRGKSVTCFLERRLTASNAEQENLAGLCGAPYHDEVVRACVDDGLWRVYQGLLFEKTMYETFQKSQFVSCKACGYAEVKDPPLKQSITTVTAICILDTIRSIDATLQRARDFRYSDQILVIIILFTCELILAAFLVSIPFGLLFLAFVRFFFELTGLWVQPFELLMDVTGVDPARLIPFQPPSLATQIIQARYAAFQIWLRGLAPAYGVDPRPVPFNCPCGVASCADCGKEWTACHACHEAERDSLRLYVERAMSEAFIRTCPHCLTRYTKQSGCNKMTCPTCRFVMCYVCRQDISGVGYQHFCNHFRIVPGTKCTECELCDLYVTQEDEGALEKVAKQAEREWRRRHPGLDVGDGGRGITVAGVEIRRDKVKRE
ncbi:hypothetical protein BC830DRAFT_468503 [Chytriomyces sp. MP71]|nr:hypothetical protein BC830DRAFT_468503 [Chytriomyces sp. MP71]